jgi:hypothetical protein
MEDFMENLGGSINLIAQEGFRDQGEKNKRSSI